MRVYLDNCCLGRPLDEYNQDRIRLEAEAVLAILERIRSGEFQWSASDALVAETRRWAV